MTTLNPDITNNARPVVSQRGGNLPVHHIESLREIEHGYWWFVGRVQWARHLIGRWYPSSKADKNSYVDLGCGTGAFAEQIAKHFSFNKVILADRDPLILKSAERFHNLVPWKMDLERPFELPSPPSLITCMDVIEHIKDDQKLADRIARILQPGGLFLLSVPAHQSLFSQWDDTLGHFRRYNARQVRSILENAGLKVIELRYMWSLLAPVAWSRKLMKRKYAECAEFPKVSPLVNRTLIEFSCLERKLTDRIRTPFGTSVIAAATK